ncbi:MAG: nickel pincer cofactor biosynthesis protein LarB [Planctomycetales bacterium]|nr:nickel pincer cofactor biosynthesis protein LarB [Planctomycetales bacterium]
MPPAHIEAAHIDIANPALTKTPSVGTRFPIRPLDVAWLAQRCPASVFHSTLSVRVPLLSRPEHHSSVSELAELLTQVVTGRISATDAIGRITALAPGLSSADITVPTSVDPSNHPLTLDLDRQRRCGFPEVIYGEGKPAELIASIIEQQRNAGQASLATRVSPDTACVVQATLSGIRYNPVARTLTAAGGTMADNRPTPLPRGPSDETGRGAVRHVAVITAGSTDRPVAEEAIETLHWMGIGYRSFDDIGVAGPARLLAAVPSLREASAVVVIAGMEGALPAAVGGHLSVPVFAVPTSVGYGATLGGLTALLGMLSSCASNVAVVNIDAGFKAAYLAGLVVRQLLEIDV